MRSNTFHFKRFSVNQEASSHKVGTDGVLLGSWVNVMMEDTHILDVGTGTGLIALMLAQRTPPEVHIDAIDIGRDEAQQARENVEHSPWPHKVNVYEGALQNFNPGYPYDLIVTNPPYFVNSLLPPDQRRGTSRHAHALPLVELLANTLRLLSANGRLAVILPYTEGLHFLKMSSKEGLHSVRRTTFRARADKPPERLMMELSRSKSAIHQSEIILYGDGDDWSEEYRRLTQDFYLRG